MPMTKTEIDAAIKERLGDSWSKRMSEEGACPIVAIGIKQLPGPEFSRTVIATIEDIDAKALGLMLVGIGRELLGGTFELRDR